MTVMKLVCVCSTQAVVKKAGSTVMGPSLSLSHMSAHTHVWKHNHRVPCVQNLIDEGVIKITIQKLRNEKENKKC